MAIDACQHKFIDLARNVFPIYLERLRSTLKAPIPLQVFARPKIGPKAIARELGITDFGSGCYVLLDESKPIYVGISRDVFSRLRQHVIGRTHFDASLAYRVAKKSVSIGGTRSGLMKTDDFKKAFEGAQTYLRNLNCAFVSIPNPLELYLFEAFAAMEFDTADWNTFVTH